MNCKLCNTKNMDFIFRDDRSQCVEPDYCYNLHHCSNCGGLVKEDVWHEDNQTWIKAVPELKDDPLFEVVDGDTLRYTGDRPRSGTLTMTLDLNPPTLKPDDTTAIVTRELCECGVEGKPLHVCPLEQDIYNNDELHCHCCDNCRHECVTGYNINNRVMRTAEHPAPLKYSIGQKVWFYREGVREKGVVLSVETWFRSGGKGCTIEFHTGEQFDRHYHGLEARE